MADRSHRIFRLAKFVQHVAEWLLLLTLLFVAWALGGLADVGWVLMAWLVPRIVVVALADSAVQRFNPRLAPALIALLAALAAAVGLATMNLDLLSGQIMIAAAAVAGSVVAVGAESRTRVLTATSSLGRLGPRALDDARISHAGMFVGSGLAAVLLNWVAPAGPMFIAAALLAIAAALVFVHLRDRAMQTDVVSGPRRVNGRPPAVSRRIAIYSLAAFASGVLGSSLLILSFPLAAAGGPLLVAAVAAGLLLGPLPVPRLLLRIPAPMLLLATSLTSAAVVAAVAIWASLWVALVALPFLGVAAVTQAALCAIAVRRLVPSEVYARASRLMLLALTVGQVVGVASILVAGSSVDPLAALLVVAVAQVVLVGIGVALGGPRAALQVGGMSSLPIKSVIHKLSWDTRPAAAAADFAGKEPRARRLAKWINRHVEVERLTVTLPISRREYAIYRPDEASRERLFEHGRADPEKQLPYWAKVWPSGVALANVVLERKIEVADKHVLELGAGLGVTACAILEHGGQLVTADYSALPLAHCRLNTLVNTGRSPRATCFNWRHHAEVAAVTAQAEFKNGFPLIIAGDVLYEGRDAEPLLNVIDRLLVADGSLWLAEPVRRTAQRFLDSAAALGWEIESRQVKAEWPDATDGPVNLHFLTRSPEPDRVIADVGGWRI